MTGKQSKQADGASSPVCDHCGADDAHPVGEGHLCADCFQLAGSTCGGGGVSQDITRRLPASAGGTPIGSSGTC